MKKIQIFAMAALVALGLASCTKEQNGAPAAGTEGGKARLMLSFKLPAQATRANDGDQIAATPAENTVKTVEVFVFTAAGDPAAVGAYTSFSDLSSFLYTDTTPADGIADDGKYTLDPAKAIQTLSGAKIIYVGINSSLGACASQSELLAKLAAVSAMDVANNFTMFTDAASANLLAYDYNSGTEQAPYVNTVTMNINRVVAKVAASSSAPTYTTVWPATGATDAYLHMVYTVKDYRVIQGAIKSYVAPNYWSMGAAKTYVNSVATLPGDVFNPFATDAGVTATSIKTDGNPTDAAAIAALAATYTGENYPFNTAGTAPLALNMNTTYAIIATTVLCDAEASWDATTSSVKWTTVTPYGGGVSGSDVFMVVGPDKKNYVCASQTAASDLANGLFNNDLVAAAGSIYTYYWGYVHFPAYLNKKGLNDYEIARNQFAHIKINGVTEKENLFPGYPGDPGDPTKPTDPQDPTNPDPLVPTDPVDGSPAYLNVQVTVMPWVYKGNDITLGN